MEQKMLPNIKKKIVSRSRPWQDTSISNGGENFKTHVLNRFIYIWEKRKIVSE